MARNPAAPKPGVAGRRRDTARDVRGGSRRSAAVGRSADPGAAKTPKIEVRAIGELIPYDHNARTHSADQIAQIAASIREFGWTNPVLLDGHNGVIAGHARLAAARLLGLATVPCIELAHLTEAQKRAYILADNKLALNAGWDLSLLAGEIQDLQGLDFDLNLLGFGDQELAELLAYSPGTEGLTDPDECPEVPINPVTKPGDLWILGKHRLLCGDATKPEDVGRLMAGEKADMVFTDPPYGVDYDGGTTVRRKLTGDKDTSLYHPACQQSAQFSKGGAALYLWHAGVKGIAAAAAAAAAAAGYEIRCELVWNKNHAQFGSLSAQYKQKHEPCYYCYKKGNAPQWFGPTNEVTVWDCDRATRNDFHPTQKPVALCERALGNSSKFDDVILDLFGGSGSTLIACAKRTRHCRMMEIDTAYCDVFVTRWQNFTGQQAVLDGTKKTFAEVTKAQAA